MKTLNGICCKCQSRTNKLFYSYENKLLPTWKTKNNIKKYALPSELQHRTLAEKLLIPRVSPLVPVIHIKWDTWNKRSCCKFLSRYSRNM